MTLYELVKQSFHREAVRTEPDRRTIIEKVLKEIEKKWKKRN